MYHFYDVVINDNTGVPLTGVIIRLYTSAGVLVPLFADEAGTTPIEAVSGIANAAVTDGDGNYDFYVADGKYDIRFFIGDALLKVLQNIQMVVAASDLDVQGKAQADAVGIAGDAANLGTGWSGIIPDNSTVKSALQKIETAINHIVVDVTDYGADTTGASACDAAVSAAYSKVLSAGGGVLYFPAGTYKIDTGSFPAGASIWGAGPTATQINVVHPTNDIFQLGTTSGQATQIRDIMIRSDAGVRTGGSFIKIDHGSGVDANNWCAENVIMLGHYVGISSTRSSVWKIIGCFFGNYSNSFAGLVLDNLQNGDSGDNGITLSTFTSDGSYGGNGINWHGGGGLRISNCKFNVLTKFIDFNLDKTLKKPDGSDLDATTIIKIENCSLENPRATDGIGVHFRRTGGTSHLTAIQIISNQFSIYQNPGGTLIKVEDDGTVFRGAMIHDNYMIVCNGGRAIDLQGGLAWSIKNNSIVNPFNAPSTPNTGYGIRIGTNAVKADIDSSNINVDGSITNWFANTSSSTIFHERTKTLTGKAVDCQNAFGPYFFGQITVTWPADLFVNSPTAIINSESGGWGGVIEGTMTPTSVGVRMWSPGAAIQNFSVTLTGYQV